MLVTLYKIGEVHFRLLGTDGFHAKEKNERFAAAGLRCRQNLKYEKFTLSFGNLRQKNCTEERATLLFFLVQPIKSLICGVVVASEVISHIKLLISLLVRSSHVIFLNELGVILSLLTP